MKNLLVLTALLTYATARVVLPRWPVKVLLKEDLGEMPEIVGGDVASKGEIPWQVSMQAIGFFGPSHICGASIYSDRWILSAAHCLEGTKPSRILLVVGEYDLKADDNDEQELPVEKIILHEGFVSKTYENDIALLKTTIPITFNQWAKPIPLAAKGEIIVEGTNTTVSGWGVLHSGDKQIPNLLHKVVLPVIGDPKCREYYGEGDILDNMMCAGFEQGGKDTCQGDSGGPQFITDPLKLIGIVSWGNDCALPGYPGVYTEVSYFVDWILQTIANN